MLLVEGAISTIVTTGALAGETYGIGHGGKWSAGFWSGFASSVLAPLASSASTFEGKIAMSAIVGGTASELGGGKFANGAVTGAFVMMYNELGHATYPSKDKFLYVKDSIDLNKNALLQGALDGHLTLDEANAWYRYGEGKSLTVDGNKLSYIRTGLTNEKGNYTAVVIGVNNYKVHGQVTIKASNGHIYDGKYDFEMHGNLVRDFGTVLGQASAGQGNSYLIEYRY